MDPASAKLIGAGLAAIGTGAAAIGVGNLFGQFLQGALRNPSAADGQFGRLIFGFAVTEALGIFALLIAFLLLFALSCPRNSAANGGTLQGGLGRLRNRNSRPNSTWLTRRRDQSHERGDAGTAVPESQGTPRCSLPSTAGHSRHSSSGWR